MKEFVSEIPNGRQGRFSEPSLPPGLPPSPSVYATREQAFSSFRQTADDSGGGDARPASEGTDEPRERTTLDDETLKEVLRGQLRAYNEGLAEDIGGPFTEREEHVLMEIFIDGRRDWVRQRRVERRRLKSQIGKREFNRLRRLGELYQLY